MLANHKKGIFPLKRAFLGESQRPAFQSNFKFEAGDTLNLFDLRATNIYIILQNSWLFTYGISVRKAFQSNVFHLREQQ